MVIKLVKSMIISRCRCCFFRCSITVSHLLFAAAGNTTTLLSTAASCESSSATRSPRHPFLPRPPESVKPPKTGILDGGKRVVEEEGERKEEAATPMAESHRRPKPIHRLAIAMETTTAAKRTCPTIIPPPRPFSKSMTFRKWTRTKTSSAISPMKWSTKAPSPESPSNRANGGTSKAGLVDLTIDYPKLDREFDIFDFPSHRTYLYPYTREIGWLGGRAIKTLGSGCKIYSFFGHSCVVKPELHVV